MRAVQFIHVNSGLNDISDLTEKPRGGMITSLYRVSEHLAERGHTVHVATDIQTPGKTARGVTWGPELLDGMDVVVFNRGCHDALPQYRFGKRILWTHDLPHAGFMESREIGARVDTTVFMSAYARDVWQTFYPALKQHVYIPNGVDRSLFYPRSKEFSRLIFASAPNRGLKKLALLQRAMASTIGPEVEIVAYSNLGKLHPTEPHEDWTAVYNEVRAAGVQLYDPLPQQEYAEALGQAGLLVMPSDYPEICSNNILQALASGTPVVTTGGLGSAPEFVRHGFNGLLTKYMPHDYVVYDLEFTRLVKGLLRSERDHAALMENAATTPLWSWERVGEAWHQLIK